MPCASLDPFTGKQRDDLLIKKEILTATYFKMQPFQLCSITLCGSVNVNDN